MTNQKKRRPILWINTKKPGRWVYFYRCGFCFVYSAKESARRLYEPNRCPICKEWAPPHKEENNTKSANLRGSDFVEVVRVYFCRACLWKAKQYDRTGESFGLAICDECGETERVKVRTYKPRKGTTWRLAESQETEPRGEHLKN